MRPFILIALVALSFARAQSFGGDAFGEGVHDYRRGDPAGAAEGWSQLVQVEPAAGTFVNLGLAEWQLGRRGPAVLAWERALWVDPFNVEARENLRFARKVAQLEAPTLAWFEAASLWLPVNAWALVAGISLWAAVAMVTLPRILRWRRASWQQALAAAGFAIFLLCLPSLYGIHARSHLGIVLEKDTELRLTPTQAAQTVMLLPAGQPARWERARGEYLLVRIGYGRGWIESRKLGLVCPK